MLLTLHTVVEVELLQKGLEVIGQAVGEFVVVAPAPPHTRYCGITGY